MSTPHPQPDLNPRAARELTGTLSKIIFCARDDDDSGAVIAAVKLVQSAGAMAAPTNQAGEAVTEVVVSGTQADGDGLECGQVYRFVGQWKEHHRHGWQFRFGTYVRVAPFTRAAVVKYLSDICDGIGKRKAEALHDHFGGEAVNVVRSDPVRVSATGLLTYEQADAAALALHQEGAFQDTKLELFALLDRRGFPGSLVRALIQRFGARAARIARANPYGLMVRRLPGCGFKRCDKLYLDLGGRRDALKRQLLAGWNHLNSDNSGHTWFSIRDFERALLAAVPQATPETIVQAVVLGRRAKWLATRRDGAGKLWVAEYGKAANERTVADKLLELNAAGVQCLWPAPSSLSPDLTPHQRDRIGIATVCPVGILAGTPGTGKTFSMAALVREVVAQYGLASIAVAAPTGKAAVRCSAAMARYGLPIEATTIHRLLKVTRNGHDRSGWGFAFNAKNPLPFKFLVIDEDSMRDTDLGASLLAACAPGTHVLFVGDPFQLPPVGHGAPLRDMIAARVPCGELTEIQRNAGDIVHACAAIKAGDRFAVSATFNPDTGDNLLHMDAEKPEQQIDALTGLLARWRASGRFDPVWDCQVLVAVNRKSELSRVDLNRVLQAVLNADGLCVPGNPFKVGDKVICLKNSLMTLVSATVSRNSPDPDTYADVRDVHGQAEQVFLANGEIGRVLAVGPRVVIVTFPLPERVIRVPLGKGKAEDAESGAGAADENGNSQDGGRSAAGCDFDLAYAVTGHKMQGSEAPAVIVMADPAGSMVCTREWVYTAISRASRLCVLIGRRAVLDMQCKRVGLARRKTFLKELLTTP